MNSNKIKETSLKALKSQLMLPIAALLLMLIINVIIIGVTKHANFFKISINNGVLYGYIIDILNRSSELVILAVGMTLVAASSRGTDISVGSVMAVSGALIVRLLGENETFYSTPLIIAIICGILIAVACGAFNGLLVAKLNIQPMVATLILFTAGRGIAQLISSRNILDAAGNVIGASNGVILYVRKESFRYIGGFLPHCIIPTPIFIAILFTAITVCFLKWTAAKTYIQTVGINPRAGRLVGINSSLVIFFCYMFSGLSSGVAGLIASSRIYSSDANNIGLNMEMDAILAVALGGNSLGGGKFNLAGSIIGAITIQALNTCLYAVGVSGDQLPLFKAIVVIAIVLFQAPAFQKWFNTFKNRINSKKANAIGDAK